MLIAGNAGWVGLAGILAGMLSLGCGFGDISTNEIWDSTTLDVHGEERSLAGAWEHLPWDSLDKVPDFAHAQPIQIPGAVADGAFRTEFFSQAKPDRRTILHFDAVAYRCTVFVNGKPAGAHAGGVTPFELDVTKQVHSGSNELIVLVLGDKGRELSSESKGELRSFSFNAGEQALPEKGSETVLGGGMWPVPGIRQGVFVREVPLLRVADTTLVTSYRQLQLTADISLVNESQQDLSGSVQLEVLPYDIPSKAIGETPIWTRVEKVALNVGQKSIEIVQPWRDAKLWMPGEPHLYIARVRLLDSSGKVIDERNLRFGFREIWIEGRHIILNGKPFRAFVHGDLDSEATPEATRALFKQILAAGINTVRASCRPPVLSLTDIADEMGVAIIGESELAFNSNYAYENPVFWSNFERSWRERIARDKNHPSILLWSLANEVIISSPGRKIGQHFHDAYVHLRQIDPTRPFMQDGDGDLRDMRPNSTGFPIDIINLHPYDINPRKNPLWVTEFPPIAWALQRATKPQDIPATNQFGDEMPDRSRPWFVGEFGGAVMCVYPDASSFWTGPKAYRDLFGYAKDLFREQGEIAVIQIEAFRDMDMAGMDPWDMPDKTAYASYLRRGLEPITTFARDLKCHWLSGKIASRPVVTLNDSFLRQDLKLVISLKRGANVIARKETNLTLEPGARKETACDFVLPHVAEKTPIQFIVQLTDAAGNKVSGFQQDWYVYPDVKPAQEWHDGQVWLCGTPEGLGAIGAWAGVPVRSLKDLRHVDRVKPLAVVIDQRNPGSLDPNLQNPLESYVRAGGMVIYLGSDKPLIGDQALVSNPNSDSTRLFLLRRSPLTAGTTNDDWEFWQPDHFLSHGNYTLNFDPLVEYPLVGGGRNGPIYTPLAVCGEGDGTIIACRLQLNQALPGEPVIPLFLNNLVAYAKASRDRQAQKQRQPKAEPSLALFCPASETTDWKVRMARARIPVSFSAAASLVLRNQVAFLSGKATPTSDELSQFGDFVKAGGTLWLHRLTPDTAYLDRLSTWFGQTVTLRPPAMTVQQLELVTPDSPPRLLDGINDFFTCWATFGWTNGDMCSVRTTPIVDEVLDGAPPKSEALLKEPDWTGTWRPKGDTQAAGYTLSDAIVLRVGIHTQNRKPGFGLVVVPLGKGRIVVDQLRWDDVMMDVSSESKDKARYFAGTLWKNVSSFQPLGE